MSFKEASISPERAEKYYLYKGLDIRAFPIYFEQGYIAPMRPDRDWISESPTRAHRAALMYSSEIFSNQQNGRRPYILTVINPSVIRREGLLRGSKCHDLYGNYHDFYGSGAIHWNDIQVMLVNQHGFERVEEVAEVKNFQQWDTLKAKARIIGPDVRLLFEECQFVDDMLELNRREHY